MLIYSFHNFQGSDKAELQAKLCFFIDASVGFYLQVRFKLVFSFSLELVIRVNYDQHASTHSKFFHGLKADPNFVHKFICTKCLKCIRKLFRRNLSSEILSAESL